MRAVLAPVRKRCLCYASPPHSKTLARPSAAVLLLLATVLTTVSCRSSSQRAAGTEGLAGSRPNIVIIITDDQGYGELSCHGNPMLRTPNLDRLHGSSVRLTQFHVSPTCAPTRAALLTGKHEFRSGVTHTIFERERLSLRAATLPNVLRQAGYTTGIFGKWHLGDEDGYLPNRRGFDETFIHGGGGIGQTYPGSCGDAPENSYRDPWIWHNDRFVKTTGYCTDIFFDKAAEWIEKQKGKRFFAWIAPNVPHDPFISPGPEWETPYRAAGLNANAVRYYAMIEHLDAAVGRFLEQLDRSGAANDTLLIFMTDNGHSVGSVYNAGMRAMKGTPYQGGIRVPSFWRWPGRLAAGVDRSEVTAHIDVFPTLAELAGARVPGGVEGRSLLPILNRATIRESNSAAGDESHWPERFLFTHLGRWETGQAEAAKYKGCAVRKGPFKLVNNTELYDLFADPGETNNVITVRPEVAAEMRSEYEKWWTNILPAALEHEHARGPQVNAFKERFWAQFGKPAGTNDWAWKMNPELKFDTKRPRL